MNEIYNEAKNMVRERFPVDKYIASCLIYSKGDYGIFLLEGKDGVNYTVKIGMSGDYLDIKDREYLIGFYVKKFAENNPNLLHPEGIYFDRNPISFDLFRSPSKRLNLPQCKVINWDKIFTHVNISYQYYVTKACSYNLGYYLGANKGTLSYDAFVSFSFQLLSGLETLHRLGVWHHDIKTQNILVCESDIAKKYKSIKYKYQDKFWIVKYSDLDNRDLKIIDYGESFVEKNVVFACSTFTHETDIALANVIQTMWSKVANKGTNENSYIDLIYRLKNCKTNIIDIMQSAKIYEQLKIDTNEKNSESSESYEVNLFPITSNLQE